jgi:hypothetical protein
LTVEPAWRIKSKNQYSGAILYETKQNLIENNLHKNKIINNNNNNIYVTTDGSNMPVSQLAGQPSDCT